MRVVVQRRSSSIVAFCKKDLKFRCPEQFEVLNFTIYNITTCQRQHSKHPHESMRQQNVPAVMVIYQGGLQVKEREVKERVQRDERVVNEA